MTITKPNPDTIKVLVIISLICLVALTSCSASFHLRRAIQKDPTIIQPEIVQVVDTVIITPSERTETTFVALPIDTITIEKERLRIKIRRIHDTLRVEGECRSDTITITETIELPPVIKYEDRPWWSKWLMWGLAGLFGIKVVNMAIDRLLGGRG
jgi:uncharacterized alpha/beta hydrolase family protein